MRYRASSSTICVRLRPRVRQVCSRIRVLNVWSAFGAIRRSPPSFEMLKPRKLRPSGRATDLADYRLIHSVKSQMQWGRWFTAAGVVPKPWRRVLFDRSHMSTEAGVNGIGIALESDLMMWRELESGALACPLRRPPPAFRVTQWLVCPHDPLPQRRVRGLVDWIREERDLWLTARNEKPRAIV